MELRDERKQMDEQAGSLETDSNMSYVHVVATLVIHRQ